jgi:hypothetical protein
MTPSFNPVLGFLPASTSPNAQPAGVIRFQSRAGFSARRDQYEMQAQQDEDPVSIPCWVFCPSRPVAHPDLLCRSREKTQHGIETHERVNVAAPGQESRRAENPARD